MIQQIIGALLIGAGFGAGLVAVWAFHRIGEEGARQFDAGVMEGQWRADLNQDPPSEIILP